MFVRIILGAAVMLSGAFVYAQQNCMSKLTLTQPCAGSSVLFKRGDFTCNSQQALNVSGSICKDPSAIFADANSACAAKDGCAVKIVTNIRSKLQPHSVNLNLVKVVWSNTDCYGKLITRQVVLDKNHALNAAFLNAYPAPTGSSYISSGLYCPTAAVLTKDALGNSLYSYPEGCFVGSYSNSSQPYCMIL